MRSPAENLEDVIQAVPRRVTQTFQSSLRLGTEADAGSRFRGRIPPMVKIWVIALRQIVRRVMEIDERAICDWKAKRLSQV